MDRKIVVIRRRTRLQDLVARFNTIQQARFYVEHLGADFDDYVQEDREYQSTLSIVEEVASRAGRVHILERGFLPNYLFDPSDLVVSVGQDGMVANSLKYLDGQPLIGVNPSPSRFDGILARHKVEDLDRVLAATGMSKARIGEISMAEARLPDGQRLLAVNDLFVGSKTHVSAHYDLFHGKSAERQVSSGIVVSTGLGSTGWMRSILGTAASLTGSTAPGKGFPWEERRLEFAVREAFPSRSTQTTLVRGALDEGEQLVVLSRMPENGTVFSDGIESDYLAFDAGSRLVIALAARRGKLVVRA